MSGPLSSPTLLPPAWWDKGETEACFRRAIEVARGQGAKSWKLRATTSLARLLREQGRRDEAREMLAAIYGWFTEGFDRLDLTVTPLVASWSMIICLFRPRHPIEKHGAVRRRTPDHAPLVLPPLAAISSRMVCRSRPVSPLRSTPLCGG